MKKELANVPSRDLGRAGLDRLPAAIGRAGESAAWRFVEFFTATIRNRNTRAAYAQSIGQFFAWCEEHRVQTLGEKNRWSSPPISRTIPERRPR